MENTPTSAHQNSKKTSTKDVVFIDVSAEAKPPTSMVVKEEPLEDKQIEANSAAKPAKERLQCSECSRVCYSTETMVRHLRVHRGENPFQCVVCEYSTYNKTLFQEHVNIHMGIKPYQCSLCDYRSVSKKYIKKHESSHVTCDKCGYVARNIRRLRRHREHDGCGSVPDQEPGEFTCDNCDMYYSTRQGLNQHKKCHKKCPHCDKSFTASVLIRHKETEHGVLNSPPTKRYKFKCKECAFKANVLSKILLHLIHHPQQVSKSIDITPLVKSGILTRD